MVSDRIRDNCLASATVAFVVYTIVMLLVERRMRATGGPGIIPFELAGSAAQAEDIRTRWVATVTVPTFLSLMTFG